MIKEYIKGSILDAPQKYIAHGVNCQNKMGSGVAKVLFTKYPSVKEEYHEYCEYMWNRREKRGKDLLGRYCTAPQYPIEKVIINAFTQNKFGYDGEKYVDYEAIYKVFKSLSQSKIKEVAIPKIGCGLAGGNWEIVSRLIDDATGNDLDVYVYYLE